MKSFVILLIVLPFIAIITTKAQIDTEFWFVAPECASNGNDVFDKPIYFRISTYDKDSKIEISMPAQFSKFPTISLFVPAYSSKSVDLTDYIDIIENKPPDYILNYGIYIKSDNPVSIYYEIASENKQVNPELFTLKGKNALGKHFFIPGQNKNSTNTFYFPLPYFAFDIVASEDNTVVTIIPKSDLVNNHLNDIPFKVRLNRGQTYSAASMDPISYRKPIGSEVIADKPIAITVKDDLIMGNNGCADILGDQIVPIDYIGKEYIVIRGFMDNEEFEAVSMTATEDNTNIFINKNPVPLASLNKGQTYTYSSINTDYLYIQASSPIYAFHISGVSCELGGALLPKLECTGSTEISYRNNAYSDKYLLILTETKNIGYFLVNSTPNIINSINFTSIPLYPKFAFTRLDARKFFQPPDSTTIIKNTHGLFQLGLIQGRPYAGASYGYFSDFSSFNLGSDISSCDNTAITLDAGANKNTYLWSTGARSQKIVVSQSGKYWAEVSYGDCILRDTINVQLGSSTKLELGNDTSLCSMESITLDAGAGHNSYNWNTGDNQRYLNVVKSGKYWVEVVSPEGCILRDTIQIVPKVLLAKLQLIGQSNPCYNDSVKIIFPDSYQSINWFDVVNNKIIAQNCQFLHVQNSGTFTAVASDKNGCTIYSDTLSVILNIASNSLDISSLGNPPKFIIDTTIFPELRCSMLKIKNNSNNDFLLDNNIFLFKNTAFSIPQSQLPLSIPAKSYVDINLCYCPTSDGLEIDTLILNDICSSYKIPIEAVGVSLSRDGLSYCNLPINIRIRNSKKTGIINITDPYPNPATNSITFNFSKYQDDFSIDCLLINSIGEIITSYKPSQQKTYDVDSPVLEGVFTIITSNLNNGLYNIIIRNGAETRIFAVIIER